jgi:hypothetical protein
MSCYSSCGLRQSSPRASRPHRTCGAPTKSNMTHFHLKPMVFARVVSHQTNGAHERHGTTNAKTSENERILSACWPGSPSSSPRKIIRTNTTPACSSDDAGRLKRKQHYFWPLETDQPTGLPSQLDRLDMHAWIVTVPHSHYKTRPLVAPLDWLEYSLIFTSRVTYITHAISRSYWFISRSGFKFLYRLPALTEIMRAALASVIHSAAQIVSFVLISFLGGRSCNKLPCMLDCALPLLSRPLPSSSDEYLEGRPG